MFRLFRIHNVQNVQVKVYINQLCKDYLHKENCYCYYLGKKKNF